MKHLILTVGLWICITITSFAQGNYQTAAYYDGYWSKWETQYLNIFNINGNYHSMTIYNDDTHPSDFYFEFWIDNFIRPDKKEIKRHYKKKIWYEYTGWVRYNITDKYPTFKDALKNGVFPNFPYVRPHKSGDKKPTVTQKVKATIKIAPYKEHPQCYNIYFDGVGFAIDITNNKFTNW